MVVDVDVCELVKELGRRLRRWEEDEKISLRKFLTDKEKQDSISYNMLVAIQSAIDLGNYLIEERGLEPASTYAEVFEILARHRIVTRRHATKLKRLARFRNVLAHLYWRIDYKRVYRMLKTGRKPLERFLSVVERFVRKSEAGKFKL